ncbi:hypothetical protein ACET3Z_002767 [Daucus carota]
MRDEGFQPDEMSVVSVLVACGDLGDLSCGKLIEGFVTESEINLNSYVGSALINMYGKCGDLISARSIFDRMKQKDVVIWNAMITGYAQNGMSNEVISLFKSMIEAGVSTDRITLIGLLSACATIGLLDVGNWVKAYASEIGLLSDVYISTALIDMSYKLVVATPIANVSPGDASLTGFKKLISFDVISDVDLIDHVEDCIAAVDNILIKFIYEVVVDYSPP